jgi:hypothetical protein
MRPRRPCDGHPRQSHKKMQKRFAGALDKGGGAPCYSRGVWVSRQFRAFGTLKTSECVVDRRKAFRGVASA